MILRMINDIGFTIIYIRIYIYISRVVRYSQFPGRIGTLMAPEMPKIPMKCIPEKRMVCHGCHSGTIVSTCKAMLEKRRLYEKGFVTEDGKTQLPGLLHVYCRISSNSFAWFFIIF